MEPLRSADDLESRIVARLHCPMSVEWEVTRFLNYGLYPRTIQLLLETMANGKRAFRDKLVWRCECGLWINPRLFGLKMLMCDWRNRDCGECVYVAYIISAVQGERERGWMLNGMKCRQ